MGGLSLLFGNLIMRKLGRGYARFEVEKNNWWIEAEKLFDKKLFFSCALVLSALFEREIRKCPIDNWSNKTTRYFKDSISDKITQIYCDDRIEPISRYIDTLLLIPSLDGFNGLMAIIRDTYEMDPYSNSLFLFCGRRCDRIKALHFEKDGFCLLYKRLDNGRFQWPRNSSQVRKLTRQEYRWLLEGLSIDQPKAIRPVKKKDF